MRPAKVEAIGTGLEPAGVDLVQPRRAVRPVAPATAEILPRLGIGNRRSIRHLPNAAPRGPPSRLPSRERLIQHQDASRQAAIESDGLVQL